MFCGLTVPSFSGWTRGLSEKPIVSRNVTAPLPEQGSARDVAPHYIALSRLPLTTLFDHPLSLGLDQIEHRVAANTDQAMSLEQRFDLLARAAAEKRQPIAYRRIFGARPGILRRLYQKAWIELTVDDDEPPARPQHTDPLVDRRLRVRQCPQY